MSLVHRTYECAFGHRWKDLVSKGALAPTDCPMCDAIVEAIDPPHAPARARSDTVAAPGIRGDRTKAIQRFEQHAFKRPHFDDGKPLFTNLKDNVREGESHAVPETPSTNETMRMMKEQIDRQQQTGAPAGPFGWQSVGGTLPGTNFGVGAMAPQAAVAGTVPRPVVDLQGKRPA